MNIKKVNKIIDVIEGLPKSKYSGMSLTDIQNEVRINNPDISESDTRLLSRNEAIEILLN